MGTMKPATRKVRKYRRARRADSPNGTDLTWVTPEEVDQLVKLDCTKAGKAVANLAPATDDLLHERRHMNAEKRDRMGNDYLPVLSPVKVSAPRVFGGESESEEE